jgi:hypothetical protein
MVIVLSGRKVRRISSLPPFPDDDLFQLKTRVDEKEAAKHPYVPDYRPEWRWEDGAVADW